MKKCGVIYPSQNPPMAFSRRISLASSSQHHSRRDLCGLYIHVLRHISYKSHEFDWVLKLPYGTFLRASLHTNSWGKKKKKKLVPRNQYRNKETFKEGSDSVEIIRLKLGTKFWSLPHHNSYINVTSPPHSRPHPKTEVL